LLKKEVLVAEGFLALYQTGDPSEANKTAAVRLTGGLSINYF
jgi:hypothetical protein